jgi:hypothetical protein
MNIYPEYVRVVNVTNEVYTSVNGYYLATKVKLNNHPIYRNCHARNIVLFVRKGKWNLGEITITSIYNRNSFWKRIWKRKPTESINNHIVAYDCDFNIIDATTTNDKDIEKEEKKSSFNPEEDNNTNECVVCMDSSVEIGILHNDVVHNCLCFECADTIYNSTNHNCPICREPIEMFVKVIN